jgi:ADP-ribosylglycohydrolase
MIEKFRGILLCSAVGDAIGKSFEDLDVYDVEEFYKELPIDHFVEPHPNSPAFFQKPNETSDETTVARLLVESIVEHRKLDIYRYFYKLQTWAFDESIHRYPDPFIIKAIYDLSNNITEGFSYSSVEGILRVVGTSMFHFYSEELSQEAAKTVVMLTHRSKESIDGAIIFNDVLLKAIKNDESLETIESRIELLDSMKQKTVSSHTAKVLDRLIEALEEGYSKERAILNIGNGSFVLEALGLSLYYFLSYGIEYPYDTFINAINSYWEFGGDTDSIGFITGALLGAYHGYEFLPEDLVLNLEDQDRYIYLADKLYKLSKSMVKY